jgi:hypothetical protein
MINPAGDTLVLAKAENRWMVNKQWPVERSWENNLKIILQKHEVRRVIKGEEKTRLMEHLNQEGVKIEIEGENGIQLEFVAGGNPTRTQSLLSHNGELYAMFVPGYERYLSSIYEMGPYEWRDRTLYYGNERSLKSLQIIPLREGSAQSLSINFEGKQAQVVSSTIGDAETLDTYLQYLNGLYADVWVPHSEHESLKPFLSAPIADLVLEDFNPERSQTLRLYDLPEDPRFYLGEIRNGNDYFLIARNRSEALLKGYHSLVKK